MKTFRDYLTEMVTMTIENLVVESEDGEESGSFDYFASSLDDLLGKPKFEYMKNLDEFDELVYDITHTAGIRQGENPDIFRYSKKHEYFTMAMSQFGQAMLTVKSTGKYDGKFDIMFDSSGKHIEVRIAKKPGAKKNGKLLIRTTNKRGTAVTTAAQENSTCAIFNALMSDPNKEINFTAYDMFESIAKQYSEHFNKSWYESFGHQMNAIINFFKHICKDPYQYRAVRYGEKYKGAEAKLERDLVDTYKKFVTAYAEKLGLSKDACDPTDIILFKYSMGNEIVAELKRLTGVINGVEAGDPNGVLKDTVRKEYLENLILNSKEDLSHILIPVSLKKINSENGSFEVMNVKDGMNICKIDSAKLSFTETNVTIDCVGKFDLKGFTNEDGDKQGNVGKLKLVMRTFGSGNVAIDCSVVMGKKTCPTLGKVPVDMWRPTLGCTVKDKIETTTYKLRQALGVTDELGKQKKIENIELDLNTLVAVGKTNTTVGEVLNGLVRDAAKAGPNCLPFVIIH